MVNSPDVSCRGLSGRRGCRLACGAGQGGPRAQAAVQQGARKRARSEPPPPTEWLRSDDVR
eukprot:scaffold2189_cov43-Prasinocladus_malaysianus.AAC.2